MKTKRSLKLKTIFYLLIAIPGCITSVRTRVAEVPPTWTKRRRPTPSSELLHNGEDIPGSAGSKVTEFLNFWKNCSDNKHLHFMADIRDYYSNEKVT